jgi:hypothetical protein
MSTDFYLKKRLNRLVVHGYQMFLVHLLAQSVVFMVPQ